ncbi:MAG TPA: MmcQ/YjbR family DNA-binding protein [Frankiaceae bacterium]|nr:MmcQ/YjbR family DNA-binding protein [Frankiaceae bacterium]
MTVTGDEFRAWALGLPAVLEKETWGHPTFRVREKMFATMAEDGSSASVKATLADQAELIAVDPATYAKAHYTGRYGWVTVALAQADPDEVRPLVVEAWRRTAPKRVAAQLTQVMPDQEPDDPQP